MAISTVNNNSNSEEINNTLIPRHLPDPMIQFVSTHFTPQTWDRLAANDPYEIIERVSRLFLSAFLRWGNHSFRDGESVGGCNRLTNCVFTAHAIHSLLTVENERADKRFLLINNLELWIDPLPLTIHNLTFPLIIQELQQPEHRHFSLKEIQAHYLSRRDELLAPLRKALAEAADPSDYDFNRPILDQLEQELLTPSSSTRLFTIQILAADGMTTFHAFTILSYPSETPVFGIYQSCISQYTLNDFLQPPQLSAKEIQSFLANLRVVLDPQESDQRKISEAMLYFLWAWGGRPQVQVFDIEKNSLSGLSLRYIVNEVCNPFQNVVRFIQELSSKSSSYPILCEKFLELTACAKLRPISNYLRLLFEIEEIIDALPLSPPYLPISLELIQTHEGDDILPQTLPSLPSSPDLSAAFRDAKELFARDHSSSSSAEELYQKINRFYQFITPSSIQLKNTIA